MLLLLILTSASLVSAQTITNGSTGTTYNSVPGTNTLNAGDTRTYTGTSANGAVLLGAGHALVINGTLSSTDPSGGARAVRLANSSGTYTITIGSTGIVQAQSNDAFKNQSSSSAITLTNNGQILALNPVPNSPFTTFVGQALDFDSNTGVSTITNNLGAVIQADGTDAIRVGSNMTITNNGSIIGNSKINDSAANNNSNYNASNSFDTSEGVDFRSASNSSLINSGTISGTRHGVDGDTAGTNIVVTNNTSGFIIGKNGSGIGSDAISSTATNYTVNNSGVIRGEYAGAGFIFDRQGLASVDGDGDGVDIDGAATINNFSTGSIRGTGAGGFDSSGRSNGSDGISIGGGIINNSGVIEGANNGIIVNNDTVASRSGVAATTITNNVGGVITGLNGFAIRLENKLGTAADNDTIINYGTITASGSIPAPSGTVTRQYGEIDANSVGTLDGTTYTGTGSARFINGDGAAIQTGEGADTVTNYGTITGNTGRAVSLEGGDDIMTISGGSAAITGSVNGGTGNDTLNLSPGIGNTFNANSVFSNFETINVNSGKTILNSSLAGNGNGAATVNNGGELSVGATGNAGDVVVKNGGTLSGIGTAGNIVLEDGSRLGPGNSPGTLNATSVLWDGGAVFQFELGTTSDALILSGALTKGAAGSFEFDFSDSGGLSIGTYDLITFASTDFVEADFDYSSSISGFSGTFTLTSGQLKFGVSSVPEPSTTGLLILGGAGLWFTLRRRKAAKAV